MELSQIMGRAGRPQFDTKGVVVIMTDASKYNYYKDQQGDSEIGEGVAIESSLGDSVATLLNTEISLSYLNSLKAATVFLNSTYFYVRLLCKFK
jgi:ATP-dependent DNA helicase HFM1/MER3